MSRPFSTYSEKILPGTASGTTKPLIRTAMRISDPKRAPIMTYGLKMAEILWVIGLLYLYFT